MAVLVEANCVIVRAEALISRFVGGWRAFKERVPQETLCTDSEIVRVAFMLPEDVESLIAVLEDHGLAYLREGESIDIAVAVQRRGFVWPCSWLELGYADLDNDPQRRLAACRLLHGASRHIVTPPGWTFEGSLSQIHGFAVEQDSREIEYLRHENGGDADFATSTHQAALVS